MPKTTGIYELRNKDAITTIDVQISDMAKENVNSNAPFRLLIWIRAIRTNILQKVAKIHKAKITGMQIVYNAICCIAKFITENLLFFNLN